jgi:hypothetical protein
MTAPSERAIHSDVACRRTQAVQYFARHDRNMHAGRVSGRSEYLLHVLRVLLGIQLFVLVVETSRMSAGVAPPSHTRAADLRGRQRLSTRAM